MVVVVGGHQDLAVATGYLNEYRLRLADLVVVTMAEEGSRWRDVVAATVPLVGDGVRVVGTVLRPRPLDEIRGRRVAYFCTAPPAMHPALAAHLRDTDGADVVHVSGNLADRARLATELPAVDADVFLVELKAAAIDAVAEHALARGAAVVLAANDPVPASGEPDLDEMLLEMARIRL
jgi:cyclic 2,3-diphosphoglycerate synthetase